MATVLKHVDGKEIPEKWAKQMQESSTGRFRITIESEKTLAKPRGKSDWWSLPMVGLWADRADLDNPTAYVQTLRKPRY